MKNLGERYPEGRTSVGGGFGLFGFVGRVDPDEGAVALGGDAPWLLDGTSQLRAMEKTYKIAKPIPKGNSKLTIVESPVPGLLGGYRPKKIYGRLDCRSALQALAKGGYVASRVFFHNEEEAIACGFRPCGNCMPEEYRRYKQAQERSK